MNQGITALMQEGYAAADRIIEDFVFDSKRDEADAALTAIDALRTAATVKNDFNTFLLERIVRIAAQAVEQA